AALYPGSSWAGEARSKVLGIKRTLLDRELVGIKAAAFDGKLPFREVLARVDRLRTGYPEGAPKIDQLETELDRARVVARAKEFAEALRTHKTEEKPERFKDLMAPETWKKAGEGWVLPAVRTAMGLPFGSGMRIEEVDAATDQMTLESGKTAVVSLKVVTVLGKARERSTHKLAVHWQRQDGDWVLPQNGIREEK
ncbi:MAG TPA: hypothetical protein VMU54_18770, partial [Planctomycetota bacterium]|nr:hypothetical protein [Planctomycetota bacterium]